MKKDLYSVAVNENCSSSGNLMPDDSVFVVINRVEIRARRADLIDIEWYEAYDKGASKTFLLQAETSSEAIDMVLEMMASAEYSKGSKWTTN